MMKICPTFEGFKRKIENIRNIEKYIAKKNNEGLQQEMDHLKSEMKWILV